jgi:hypothetical protein
VAALALAACAGYFATRDLRSGQLAPEPAELPVTLTKRSFLPAEPVLASVPGVTREMIEAGAIIGLCVVGAEHGDFLSSAFVREKDKRIWLRAPLEPGAYELRGYSDGDVLAESTLIARIKLIVEGTAAGAFSLALDKSRYAPREDIVITVRGVPRSMLDDGAHVGLYRAGSVPDDFLGYALIGERDRRITLDAPPEEGLYEVRAFASSSVFALSTLAASVPFEVAPQPPDEAKERGEHAEKNYEP